MFYRVQDLIVNVDKKVILSIHRNKKIKKTDPMANWITVLGSGIFSFPFTLFVMFFNFQLGVRLFTSLALCFFLVQAFKYSSHRLRPYHSLTEIEGYGKKDTESSYPSGHSAAAFAIAGCFDSVYHFPFPLFSLALLVGYSRIQLGHHFPSDVISGAFIGLSFSWLTAFIHF